MMIKINYYFITFKEKYLLTFITKRLDKIEELTKKIDGNNLIFTTLSTRDTTDFSKKEII